MGRRGLGPSHVDACTQRLHGVTATRAARELTGLHKQTQSPAAGARKRTRPTPKHGHPPPAHIPQEGRRRPPAAATRRTWFPDDETGPSGTASVCREHATRQSQGAALLEASYEPKSQRVLHLGIGSFPRPGLGDGSIPTPASRPLRRKSPAKLRTLRKDVSVVTDTSLLALESKATEQN